MSILKTPFRYDFVGSFLRPEKLKQAKKDFSEGKITENSGTWILCGDLKALNMRQKVAEFSLTEKLLTLKQLIL